jgi:membrane protease YdiL (CAAX protease family)
VTPDVHTDRQGPPLADRLLRLTEFALVFVAAPLLLAFRLIDVHVILGLLVVALICLLALLFDRSFPNRRLWNSSRFLPRLALVLGTFIVCGGLLTGLTAWLMPKQFLYLVRMRPAIWLVIMILYPLLSVYPQEIVYRAFLFHRYRIVFPRPWMLVCASAVAFGLAHLYFWNEIAVGLSLLGGFLFAWTYRRTESLLMAVIEHSLFGCLIFTVGLGHFFYHGTAGVALGLAG